MTTETIAVIGGTGAEGGGLALRLAAAGRTVVIGSRDAGKAAEAAEALRARLAAAGRAVAPHLLSGAASADAVRDAAIVLLTVPFAAQQSTALGLTKELTGKILVDATAPLSPPRVWEVSLPNGRSAVAVLQEALGPEVRVVAAFQNVSAHHLTDLDHELDCDVLVCGDDVEARGEVIKIIEAVGLRGIHAGGVQNAAAAEAMTSLLIAVNRAYKVKGAGIRITGLGNSAMGHHGA